MNISDVTSEEKAREHLTDVLNTKGIIAYASQSRLAVGDKVPHTYCLGFRIDQAFTVVRQITKEEYLYAYPGDRESLQFLPEYTYYELTTD